MQTEKIELKTETGQKVEAVILNKHADRIDVVIAETIRCTLTPTRNKRAYAGSVHGRELIYERSTADVEAELAKRDRDPRRHRFR